VTEKRIKGKIHVEVKCPSCGTKFYKLRYRASESRATDLCADCSRKNIHDFNSRIIQARAASKEARQAELKRKAEDLAAKTKNK
jgi:ZZ type zinc finger protein